MKNQNPNKPPRGIYIQDKKWMVPVLFGVDAKSTSAAESYGIDANNLVVMGAGMEPGDIMKMWGEQAIAVMQDLQESGNMPVSVNAELLDAMLEESREALTERSENVRAKTMLRILISVPAGAAGDIEPHVEKIRAVPGVEIDISGN